MKQWLSPSFTVMEHKWQITKGFQWFKYCSPPMAQAARLGPEGRVWAGKTATQRGIKVNWQDMASRDGW